MAEPVTFDMQGVDELVAKMEGLNYDLRRKGGRFALRKAANLIRDAARQNAEPLDDPATGQKIGDNIAVRFSTRTFRNTGNLMFRVGVMGTARTQAGGDQSAGSPTPHWRLLEFGTEKMPAKPFMRRALAENVQAATDEFVRQYGRALDRALRRQAKQGGN